MHDVDKQSKIKCKYVVYLVQYCIVKMRKKARLERWTFNTDLMRAAVTLEPIKVAFGVI